MTVLSADDAAMQLNVETLSEFFEAVDLWAPSDRPVRTIPSDSGQKVALARRIARGLLEFGPVVLWIRMTGIWPSSEHMNLFDGYRASLGELRPVQKAPVHVFGAGDEDAFVSILCLCLFFVWEVEMAPAVRNVWITLSHDEWLDYRTAKGGDSLVPFMEAHVGLRSVGE